MVKLSDYYDPTEDKGNVKKYNKLMNEAREKSRSGLSLMIPIKEIGGGKPWALSDRWAQPKESNFVHTYLHSPEFHRAFQGLVKQFLNHLFSGDPTGRLIGK